jgi:ATP/maltotriose-dependent transcriptional regulator MalT
LRQRARQMGAMRGLAFATALIGEAALLMGDLERAERELQEALDLHHDVDATAGEAHSLQRLAEVSLARGDAAAAQHLLRQALPLARWSVVSKHLLQRIYGTMILAAPDTAEALVVLERAEATLGMSDACPLCDIMLAVPAAILCADAGDLVAARRHLAVATTSATRWDGTAWDAAVLEARAHLTLAEGDQAGFHQLLDEAGRLFTRAGQPLDAARCERASAMAEPAIPG